MAQAKRLTIMQARAIRRRLEEARESLVQFMEPENENCSVPAEAREASRLYLDSWVLTQIEGALNTLDMTLGQTGTPR